MRRDAGLRLGVVPPSIKGRGVIVPPVAPVPVDPVCAFHGRRWSEHPGGRCLYCALCFTTLAYDECHELPDGSREDICNECAELEATEIRYRAARGLM